MAILLGVEQMIEQYINENASTYISWLGTSGTVLAGADSVKSVWEKIFGNPVKERDQDEKKADDIKREVPKPEPKVEKIKTSEKLFKVLLNRNPTPFKRPRTLVYPDTFTPP